MNPYATTMERVQQLRDYIVAECANPASLFRIAAWTASFLVVLLFLTRAPSTPEQTGFVEGYLRSTTDSSSLVRDLKAQGTEYRVFVYGSSEAYDFSNRQYGLGSSLAEEAPRFVSGTVDVLERTRAMLSLVEKADGVEEAAAVSADAIVVSIPIRQLIYTDMEFVPPQGEESTFLTKALYMTVPKIQNPKRYIDLALSETFPRYQLQIAGLFRTQGEKRVSGDATGERMQNVAFDVAAPEDLDEDIEVLPVLPNPDSVERLIQDMYDAASAERIAQMMEDVAAPAKASGIPVVVLISPVNIDSLPTRLLEGIQHLATLVDDAEKRLASDHIIVVNGLARNVMDPMDFTDFVHIRDHGAIATMIWEELKSGNHISEVSPVESAPNE